MKKTTCVAVLVVATLAITGRHLGASAAPAALMPQIVAKAKLVNQSSPIATTTIFTAPQDGLYRISVYPSITTAAPTSRSNWNLNLFWTDLGAPFSFAPFTTANDTRLGTFENVTTPIAIQLKAGTALTYSVTQSGSSDSSVYSLYYVLERLE